MKHTLLACAVGGAVSPTQAAGMTLFSPDIKAGAVAGANLPKGASHARPTFVKSVKLDHC